MNLNLVDGLNLPRSTVFELEAKMKNLNLENHTRTEHLFSPGIYTRILYIPKGCLLTGNIHKEPILNIMLAGEISVLLGDQIQRIKAPYICVSPPGSKKIGFAHEDTIWVGCHGTDDFDLVKIEKQFVAQDETEWLEYFNKNEQLTLGF
jgi:hypothetical protein